MQFQVIEPGSISEWVWENKYRYKEPDGTPIDKTVGDTFRRVAHAVAGAEEIEHRDKWFRRFHNAMESFEFLPGGRILAGAGTHRKVTLFNCYVMGGIEDSLTGICEALKESALTLKQGGGVGMDFSTLRHRGAMVHSVGAPSSGAVSFMHMWDSMCATIQAGVGRRGAMMGVLRVDHPDIEEFIEAKQKAGQLTNFNISVAVTDDFMAAVELDGEWTLRFDNEPVRTVSARELWNKILRSTYEYSEPGILFIDRVNQRNRLNDIEVIAASNPCGEQMLPPYGACLLGSINLARLVRNPFEDDAALNWVRLDELTGTAVRFLDNVIGISHYPLPEQRKEAESKRRIGLGITGLADMLIMLGHRYNDPSSFAFVKEICNRIETVAYQASCVLANEKGPYPLWKATHGEKRRNSHLLSIAPTGTISLFAGNVSSGIEPVFDFKCSRNVLMADGSRQEMEVEDYASRLQRVVRKIPQSTDEWIKATDLKPIEHLAMVAACQEHIDSAISKTINCPEDISFDDFCNVYRDAARLSLKGCTTYRPSPVRGQVLVASSDAKSKAANDTDDTVVSIAKPIERTPILKGSTYKVKPPGAEHALYVTINDIEVNGRPRPMEIFFNSKAIDGYQWTVALSRMISAVFRKGGDVAFVADELRQVFDPRGGFWQNKQYVPSLCSAIGDVVAEHMDGLDITDARGVTVAQMRHCPKCQVGGLERRDGCWSCNSCDYTKC